MKSNKNKRYTIIQNSAYILRYIWLHDKKLLFLILISSLSGVFMPLSGMYLPKTAISHIEAGSDASEMIWAIGLLAVLFTLLYSVSRYSDHLQYWRTNQLRTKTLFHMFYKTLRCDYELIESAGGQAKYQKAINSLAGGDWSGIPRIIKAITGMITCALGFFLFSGILLQLNIFIILILTLTSLIEYFFQKKAREYEHANKDKWALYDKRLSYFESSAADHTSGKDTRIYGMKRWFLKTRDKFIDKRIEWFKKVENKKFLSRIVDTIVILVRDGFVYIILIIYIVNGRIPLSDFVFYFGAVAAYSYWIKTMVSHAGNISSASLQVCDMREFMDLEDRPVNDIQMDIDTSQGVSIEFRGVNFSYDNQESVLKDINISIRAGERVALVGRNGAGKTTFIKLLCGLYQPDSGEILINGININYIKTDLLVDIFSPVFQDIMVLPFSVAENVSLNSVEETDFEKVEKCLNDADLMEHVASLRHGMRNAMLKIVEEEGVEFSGGQQQRLLLARALYKDAPVLLLDEPTSALDPIAESRLYRKYHDLSKARTSIFISHRLASTLFCDRILLMDEGMIKESGKHSELMGNAGFYSQMFNIQSQYYKEDFSGGVESE